MPHGIKGIRQTVTISHNPSTIAENQTLTVRFPNLSEHDVIVPGTSRLAFEIEVDAEGGDKKQTGLYNNVGRNIVRTLEIKISGNTVLSLKEADKFLLYSDLWRLERRDMVYQGVHNKKLKIYRSKPVTAPLPRGDRDIEIVRAFGNRFCIPLDFEILETSEPFYQAGLHDRLEYIIEFNDAKKVVELDVADEGKRPSYKISNIELEFEKIVDPSLARSVRQMYGGDHVYYFNDVMMHRKTTIKKSDGAANYQLNTTGHSVTGALFLFKDVAEKDPEKFYNPRIRKVDVTIEGVPNELFSQGMRPHQQYEETSKFFMAGPNRNRLTEAIAKDLHLSPLALADYLTDHYALWLDLRTTPENYLHGSGRKLQNTSEGISVRIEKEAEEGDDDPVDVYIYVLKDAQINMSSGRFVGVVA